MTDTMSKTKKTKVKAAKLFPDELIDQLLAQVQNKDAESILGESGLAGLLKKQLAERMLTAELTHHLNTEAKQGEAKAGNHRNGTIRKTVITPAGELDLTSRATGWPRLSRNWWPSISVVCQALTIM
jgi:hypothetical protein